MKKWKSITEWISIIVVMYYVAVRFYDSSRFTFTFFDLPRTITVSLPIMFATAIRFIPCFLDDILHTTERRRLVIKSILGLLFAIPCLYVARCFDYNFLVYLAVIPFCLYDIDINKVLKSFTITVGVLLATTVICSLTGIVDNQISASVGENHLGNLRNRYGIASTTDFAAYLFFLPASFWAYREKKKDIWNRIFSILLVILIIWGIYYYTSTWTSMILCLLLGFFMIYELLEQKIFVPHKKARWIIRTTETVVTWIMPVTGVIFYGLTWFYGKGFTFAIQIDRFLDSRLSGAWDSIQKYGIHAFGALTPQNGWGGDAITRWQGSYDFLDSTFSLLLVRYGWVLTIIAVFLWVWMTKKAIRSGRRRIAFVMAIIAIHCFSEHHFPELNYNILLATPFCALIPKKETENVADDAISNGFNWIPWLTSAITAVIVAAVLPRVLSRARALFAIKGWLGGEYSSYAGTALVFFGLLLLGLACFFLIKLLRSLLTKKKKIVFLAGVFIPMVMLAGIHVWTGQVIDAKAFDEQIAADTPAIKLILSSCSQPVYADQLEELYKQQFEEINERLDSIETICRNRIGTAIVNKNMESHAMLHTGAVYAEISDYSSIYTYDEAVIAALRNAGYQVRGFYYTTREMDLDAVARMNGMERDADGGILLQVGMNQIKEPDLSLYSGVYIASFDLTIPKPGMSGAVCDLVITTYNGDHIINRITLQEKDFDKTGHILEEVAFSISDSAGVEFLVYPKVPIIIHKIAYRSNPDNDTWQTYDEYNRLILERYFDLSGKPTAQSEGQYGVAYQYEKGLNTWSLRQCLDQNGVVMTGKSGYAQTSRKYNKKGQVIEERYLNETGELCLNPSGFAFFRRILDTDRNTIFYQYFGTDEQLILTKKGYAGLYRMLNEKEQVIRDEYYGPDLKPIAQASGYNAIEYIYDEAGNVVSYRYIGIDGKPVMRDDGFAEMRREYNDLNQKIEQTYYDAEGNPTETRRGFQKIVYTYYKNGNLKEEVRYDLQGNVVTITEH